MLMRIGWSADRARHRSITMPAAPITIFGSQAALAGKCPLSAPAREVQSRM